MFKLLIECSKDIDSINIVFSNGKAVATTVQKAEPESEPEYQQKNFVDSFDTDSNSPATSNMASVELPEVPDVSNRDINVANNLQNLDI